VTDAQHANLPGILQEIVDCDRQIEAARAPLSGAVTRLAEVREPLATLRRLRGLRRELSAGAAGLYGRRPLRGENGPGRPTAAAA